MSARGARGLSAAAGCARIGGMKKAPWKIRNAGFGDVAAIFGLIKGNPRELVPRSQSDIIQNVDRFLVCEYRKKIVGTASWAILPEIEKAAHPTVEIKSVAVQKSLRGKGYGRFLVEAAIERVKLLKPEQILVLTFTPEFFARFGFVAVRKETIMHKLYTGCVNCSKYDSPFTCPEVAMSLRLRR
jgi:N-acetylglutamate synthase-like GNAT family acetyltransferase